jgi:tetratricopeptide (TPR) repeat protein
MSIPTQAPRPRLSVALIARDEETVLAAALASVREIADEIVVVDTGSVDHTRAIAAQSGAKVIESGWGDDFSQARNTALEATTGDWIFWLDANEQLAPESAAELRRFVDQVARPSHAYLLMIELPAQHEAAPLEQAGRIRLIPAGRGLRYHGRIRETLLPTLTAQGMTLEMAPGRILRGPRENDTHEKTHKAQRDLGLLRKSLEEEGDQPRLLNSLGDVFCVLGQSEEAARIFARSVIASPAGSTEMLDAYYGWLTSLDAQEGSTDQQLTIALKALEAFPFDAQLLCAAGGFLQALGRKELAARSYGIAHRYGQVKPDTWHLRDIGDMAALCLAILLLLENKDEEAREILDEGLQRNPSSQSLRRRLLNLHVNHARLADALHQVDYLNGELTEKQMLRKAVRGACQAVQGNWAPALTYLRSAYDGGCRNVLCLQWLAHTLISSGDTQSAESVIHVWQQAEPRNAEIQRYHRALREGPGALNPTAAANGAAPPVAATSPAGLDPAPMLSPAVSQRELDQRELDTTAIPPTEATPPMRPANDPNRHVRVDAAQRPQGWTAQLQWGKTYRHHGNNAAAEQVWRASLEQCPGTPSIVHALFELLIDTGRTDEAIEVATMLDLRQAEHAPFAHFVSGCRASARGDWKSAVSQFEAARASGYSAAVVLNHLAGALLELDQRAAAESIVRELLFLEPLWPTGYRRLVQLYRRCGQSADAEAAQQRHDEVLRLAAYQAKSLGPQSTPTQPSQRVSS